MPRRGPRTPAPQQKNPLAHFVTGSGLESFFVNFGYSVKASRFRITIADTLPRFP
jgi:hypothetical protein